jgi:hypothetical protein
VLVALVAVAVAVLAALVLTAPIPIASELAANLESLAYAGLGKARRVSPAQLDRERLAAQLAEQYRGPIPFGLVMAIIEHETAGSFDPKITNHIGAVGLFQFVPKYQGWFGFDAGNLYDAETQIRIGCSGKLLGAGWTTVTDHLAACDPLVQYAAAYFGNAEGVPFLKLVAKRLSGQAVTWDAFIGTARQLGTIYNRPAGMLATARRVDAWEARRGELLTTATNDEEPA